MASGQRKEGKRAKSRSSSFGASKVLPSANANNRARTSGRSPVLTNPCGVQLFSASCRHYHTSSSSPRPHPPPPTPTTPSTSSFFLPRASPRSSHASEPLLPDRHHDCASAPCNNSWTTRVYTDVFLPPTRAVAATGNPSIALGTLNILAPVDQSIALIGLVDFLGLDRILGCKPHSKASPCLTPSPRWYAE
jgi:hypothetical protein